jgi:hypothetical protein
MTPFVGRRREAARIRAALETDQNVVLTGPYGIGRTALARHAARTMAKHFRFVFLDGDRSPARLCRDLVEGLFGPGRRPGERLSYRAARRQIATRIPTDARRHVVVLDDIATISHAKLELLRFLVGPGRLRFLVVVEAFLPAADMVRLRSVLLAETLVRLGPLALRDVERYLEERARALRLPLTPAQVHGLAQAAHGFPAGMRDILASTVRNV